MLEQFIVQGETHLNGEVTISGAKNAAVAIIPATILAQGKCVIENIPNISDIKVLFQILRALGASVQMLDRTTVEIDTTHIVEPVVPYELARYMRASYYLLGALLARCNRASVSMPGGCNFGVRPIDQHMKGFEALGADVSIDSGMINARADLLLGAHIYFDVVSVGATINVMLASVKAKGITILENCAKEPHIVDLANFLNSMGADIRGAGTDVIKIHGVDILHGTTYPIIPDQIEAGTLMIAAAATHGDVLIRGALPTHMEALTAKLLEMGARVDEGVGEDSIRVRSDGNHRHVNIKTLPYPGFPTDLQQPMSVLLSTARGTSIINETIYEMRFKHLEEIRHMGGISQINDRIAIIEGVPRLTGCAVTASDLRAGAALVIAGLMAEGVTDIYNVQYIDRGYEHLEDKLRSLGAKIERLTVD